MLLFCLKRNCRYDSWSRGEFLRFHSRRDRNH